VVLSVGYDINGFAWDVNSYLMQVGTSPTQPLDQEEWPSICVSICPTYRASEH
jgi:hypothetical protein